MTSSFDGAKGQSPNRAAVESPGASPNIGGAAARIDRASLLKSHRALLGSVQGALYAAVSYFMDRGERETADYWNSKIRECRALLEVVEEEELSPTPSHPKVDMGEGGVSLSVETRGKIPSPSSQGSTGTRPEVDGAFVHSDETQNWSCDYCGTEFQFTAQEVYGGLQCRCETWVSWRDEDGNAVDLIPVDGGKFAVKAREGKS